MNDSETGRAKCPYYRKTKDNILVCESCIHETRLLFHFLRRDDLITYKRRFCDTMGWEQCGYARMMLEDWELNHGQI